MPVTSSKHAGREPSVRRCNKDIEDPRTKTTSRNLKLTREESPKVRRCNERRESQGNPETNPGSPLQESRGGSAQHTARSSTSNNYASEATNCKVEIEWRGKRQDAKKPTGATSMSSAPDRYKRTARSENHTQRRAEE